MTPALPHIFDLTPETMRAWCAARGWPAFKADQVLEWVYQKGVVDPAVMTNLSKVERQVLARDMRFLSGDVVAHRRASDGVEKLLIQWFGGEAAAAPAGEEPASAGLSLPQAAPAPAPGARQTECVMIPATSALSGEARRTACVSSQVGCPVGCKFCASGIGGLEGNLTAGRIVEQVWRLRWNLSGPGPGAPPARITNVVFMGMGEPLANFASVTAAVRTMNAPWGLGISARKITISTVGLPAAITRLAREFDLPVTLALSLHAPTDELRRQLIPWAAYSTIAELLEACQAWFDKTGREVTLEYTLLRDVNDRPEHAAELARLAGTLRAGVNLIRYNEVAGMPFGRPRTDDVRAFQEALRRRGVKAHIRASRGRDIAAACGQLRHELADPARR